MSRLDVITPRVVGVHSAGIARIPHLAAFLGAERIVFRPSALTPVDAFAGWGRKPNTARPRRIAARRGVPFLALEDGFLRSLSLGIDGAPPLSLVVDDRGIYYDATRPSRLEDLLASSGELAREDLARRAREGMARIREERLSKYNAAPIRSLGPKTRARVLVVDQTAGDLSLEFGGCGPGTFDAMLAAALDEHPGAEIVVKTHPDVASGKRRGNFRDLRRDARVRLLTEPTNPIALLEEVDHVYVATSLLGFEALVVGRPVTCFGVPFYAGWGLTDDRAPVPARRGRRRTLEEVFAAAYLLYARYVDPETGARCELERIIDHLALQRRMADANAGKTICVGFSMWKRGFIPAFVASPRADVRFVRSARAAERILRRAPDARIVVWGTREPASLRAVAERTGARLCRMEDGFLRSVGLGSDLFAPASLVLDDTGIYYDPRHPSELERILQEGRFTPSELERARRLRERIVREGISKYNLGARHRVGPPSGDERQVVLVVGQVEDDASIQLGTIDVRRNETLLVEARRARPHAYLMYKPHPDVVSGNRKDSLPLHVARLLCDEVVPSASLADCLRVAHEVHTMTSLVGFEALLRGLSVVVYGQPFYAGWGLTEDRHPHPRRTRRLSVDELVAGALIRYPRYVHPATGAFTTPEAIVEYLSRARSNAPSRWQRSWPARQGRKLVNLAKGVLRAS